MATQGSSGIGSFPNVAVYLDDQSGQLPGRNLDVYAADMERIEVLEGPQGTLFGAGAQAGVLRYITNKPKLDVTEGNVNAGYAYTSGGDPSSNVDAMINLPLIADTLAVRAVVYSDTRGGYINNVPGTFSRLPTDIGIHYADYAGRLRPETAVLGTAIVGCLPALRPPTTTAWSPTPSIRSPIRACESAPSTSSTKTGMRCWCSRIKTWTPTASSMSRLRARPGRPCPVTRCSCTRRPTTRIASKIRH